MCVLLLAAALAAPSAATAVVPQLDRTSAARGELVTLSFVSNPLFAGPLRVDLVRTRDEPHVTGLRDRRLTTVASVPAGRLVPRRIRFRVPNVRPATYTLAVWLRGPNGWFNVAQGLWRDAFAGARLRLAISTR